MPKTNKVTLLYRNGTEKVIDFMSEKKYIKPCIKDGALFIKPYTFDLDHFAYYKETKIIPLDQLAEIDFVEMEFNEILSVAANNGDLDIHSILKESKASYHFDGQNSYTYSYALWRSEEGEKSFSIHVLDLLKGEYLSGENKNIVNTFLEKLRIKNMKPLTDILSENNIPFKIKKYHAASDLYTNRYVKIEDGIIEEYHLSFLKDKILFDYMDNKVYFEDNK